MLILDRSQCHGLLDLSTCIDSVGLALRQQARGATFGVHRIHVASGHGTFHINLGAVDHEDGASVLGIKCNGRFPSPLTGGQLVNGAILLQDARDGRPLALLDSQAVTVVRTAAVTAIAVRALARPGARSALVVGAGKQASAQVEALAQVLPLERLSVFDLSAERAEALVAHAESLGLVANRVASAHEAAAASEVIVTVTTAASPILFERDVAPGTVVIALGADSPGKQELEPTLLSRSTVVVDVLEQAASSGELAHAVRAGLMTEADVHATLAEVVSDESRGRSHDDQRIVFDATGSAIADVAASLVVLAAARARGVGVEVPLDK